MICYCGDCQAFLHHLKRGDLLDGHGGTDLMQVAPQTLSFTHGTERILGLRLTAKGMHRWYTSCCQTPLGNSMTPALPFIGMVVETFGSISAAQRTQNLGPVRGVSQIKSATGGTPKDHPNSSLRMLLHAARLVLGWKLGGKAWPHPFFNRNSEPNYPVTILSTAEREALRTQCGPTRDG
jgi:hypothetical protein